jgi:membrane-associated phospholipid phosphatase
VEGYFRVVALKHFPSDVLIGFVIGATCGVAVPEMHRFKRQAIRYSAIATPVGPGLSVSWTPEPKRRFALTPYNP